MRIWRPFFPQVSWGFFGLSARLGTNRLRLLTRDFAKKKRKIVHRVHVNLLYAIDIATSTPNDKSRAIGNTGVWASRVVVQGQKRCRTWGSASYSGSGY